MGKGKGKRNPTDPVDLNRKQLADLEAYLEQANSNQVELTSWGTGGNWTTAHGETRSASTATFHIGCRRDSNGDYRTCITVKHGKNNVPIDGTVVNWGSTPPDLGSVLVYYQQQFGVSAVYDYTPIPRKGGNNGDDGNDGGAGAAGGAAGEGSGSKRVVRKHDLGGYFYMDEEQEFHLCDSQGNEIQTMTESGRVTSNPHNITLVFTNSKGETYYYSRGQPTRCNLTQDRLTGRYFFKDSRGENRNAQYYGTEPRWMNGGEGSSYGEATESTKQYHTDPQTGKQYYVGSDGRTHWVTGSSSGSVQYTSSATAKRSTVQYHIDPQTGKQYYVGSDGRTHWK